MQNEEGGGVELGWIQGHSLLYKTTMKAPSTQGHYTTHMQRGGNDYLKHLHVFSIR